jgi:hypothetical protein
MAPVALWVYKCNVLNLPHQGGWGDWAEVFNQQGPVPWGGSETMRSTSSLHILWEEMAPGDVVLAYQTDQQAAVGLCVVEDLVDYVDDLDAPQREMILRPIERFPQPVKIHQLKRGDPVLEGAAALRSGFPQTLYRTTPEERLCWWPAAPSIGSRDQGEHRRGDAWPRVVGSAIPRPTSAWSRRPSGSSGTPTSRTAGRWSRWSARTSAMTCVSPDRGARSIWR